jgi:hypothetical protein
MQGRYEIEPWSVTPVLDSPLPPNAKGNRATNHQEDTRMTENPADSLTVKSPNM